jgi:hypothetical protein
MSFHDIFESTRFTQHGPRKYSVMTDDGLVGIVLATKNYNFDSFALNKFEFDSLLAAKRDGRLVRVVVVAARNNGGNNPPTYCGEIDAEKLADQLNGIVPRNGRFGEFYVLADYFFGDAAVW